MIDADGFSYRDGVLHCGTIPLTEIAARVGTPTYVYSLDSIVERYREHVAAFEDLRHHACFAVKANSSLPLLQMLARHGAGFDVNSRGELHRVLRAGADPSRVTMTGVGKSHADISDGLETGVALFNAESASECRLISDIAAEKQMTADVLLRLNPDVGTDTHPHISTGESLHKFGMTAGDIRSLAAQSAWLPGVRIRGLSFHLGSQIFSPEPYREALLLLITTLDDICGTLDIPDPVIDIGGGFGVAYNDEEQTLDLGLIAESIRSLLGSRAANFTILTEPGRSLVANAGVLVTADEHEKPARDRIFLILDAGMNDLLRPARYAAQHDIVPLREPEGGQTTVFYDVVGPVCESADTFARRYPLPQLRRGDLVALLSAGAYGTSMSSTYNSRPLAAEVIVHGNAWMIGRERQQVEDLFRGENLLTEPEAPRD